MSDIQEKDGIASFVQQHRLSLVSLLVFVAFFALAWLFPHTADDWWWGSYRGVDMIKIFFDGYNGRYLSNTLVVFLTRSVVFRSFFVAAVMSILFYQIARFFDDKSLWLYACAFALFISAPAGFLAQTLVWISGFVNYLFPIALIMLILNISLKTLSSDTYKYTTLRLIGIAFLGFFTSLILENVTIFTIGFAISMIFCIYPSKAQRCCSRLLFYRVSAWCVSNVYK